MLKLHGLTAAANHQIIQHGHGYSESKICHGIISHAVIFHTYKSVSVYVCVIHPNNYWVKWCILTSTGFSSTPMEAPQALRFSLLYHTEAANSKFDPGNRLPWDIRFLFKAPIIFFIKVCIGKPMSVLLTLWIPALGSPLSNLCCRCAGIILQNWCRLANRVT